MFFNKIRGFLTAGYFNLIRGNSSLFGRKLRSKYLKTNCKIDTNVFITNKNNFRAGKKSALYHSVYILNDKGFFSIGEKSHLGAFCYVNVYKGKIEIGRNVAIGPHTCIISYSNYYKRNKKITDTKIQKNVEIGSNVFIGANCTILPGCIINDNVVVGAGSVVKGTLEANAIYAGSPCKLIRQGWYQ